jgi:hypothetical protein
MWWKCAGGAGFQGFVSFGTPFNPTSPNPDFGGALEVAIRDAVVLFGTFVESGAGGI